MNDVYRVRAWDAKLKKMFDIHEMKFSEVTGALTSVFGYVEEADDSNGWRTRYGGNITKMCAEGQRYFIMRCTGLRDKNGRLIFEGDIVRLQHPFKNRGGIYKVVYDEYMFNCKGFCQTHFYYPGIAFSEGTEYFEVLGNRFDHPELMGVEG